MNEQVLFAQVLELGRLMGWHDGSGRSQHQEYVKTYRRKKRRLEVLHEDEALIVHADALNKALVEAALAGGELADLVLEQQKDDRTWIQRPRHVLSLDDTAAVMALKRRPAWAEFEDAA